MKIVILGAGGMGTLFAARLIEGGQTDVALVNHNPDYVAAVNARGILFRDSKGVRAIPARAYESPAALAAEGYGAAELVIVFVKGYANAEAVRGAQCVTGPETDYLTLQNGLGNAETIAETGVVAPEHIFFGRTTEGGTLTAPGEVFHKAEGHRSETRVMPFRGEVPERLRALAALLSACGIRTEVDRDAELAIWEKVTMNCVGNSMAALLRMSTKSLLADENGPPLARMIAYEAAAVARAKGLDFPDARADAIIERLRGNDLQASTGQDVLCRRRTEIDTLNGAIMRLGRVYGVPTPANELLYRMVAVLENNYDKTWDLGGAPAVCMH